MKKLLRAKRGEGYVDMCIGVVVFVMILVIAVNIFSFITLRIEMDQIADDLIEAATYSGCFNSDFWSADSNSSISIITTILTMVRTDISTVPIIGCSSVSECGLKFPSTPISKDLGCSRFPLRFR